MYSNRIYSVVIVILLNDFPECSVVLSQNKTISYHKLSSNLKITNAVIYSNKNNMINDSTAFVGMVIF